MSHFYAILDHRGALRVSGPDAEKFLQGQTTCDFGELSAQQALPGAYCTPQGRVVCDFRANWLSDDSILLQMQADLCHAAASVFGKYIVFSRAELQDCSTQWVQVGIWGPEAATLAGIEQASQWSSSQHQQAYWSQCDEQATRFEACLPAGALPAFETWLATVFARASADEYRAQEMRAGIGHVEAATTEQYLPQMLNYQLTGHLNFKKGCYTGQEIVARLHYKGKTKRPLYLFLGEGITAPTAGTAVTGRGSERDEGSIVNAVDTPQGALMLISAAQTQLTLGDKPLQLLELPYTLPQQQGN